MDHGFHHAIIGNNQKIISHILENIVYIELLRRGYEIKVGNVYKKEIDFVCEKTDKKLYIQVSYLLASDKTIEREFNPFYDIKDRYPCYILSMDEFDMSQNGVKHMNILEFLKGDEI